MVCIHCGSNTQVINSRLQKRSNRVWRRRQCLNCSAVFTTEEASLLDAAWTVENTNKRLQPFSRDKLLISLYKSCQHRPTALQDAAGLTDTAIKKLAQSVDNGKITNSAINQAALVILSRFDKVAGVHYQAFHTTS